MSETVAIRRTNRLINERSPYLLQHAYNPVDWYPWGAEAFDRARREDKPVFLSVGYASCHWCHVMEKESFSNPELARLLNETFVCVKVDREERPDIDATYMTVCQLLTGGGGWPLTVLLTPAKEPFFAATYIPRETRVGVTGLMDFVPKIRELWEQQKDDLVNSAREITASLRQLERPPSAPRRIDREIIRAAFRELSESFDEEDGGFGEGPKFPVPQTVMFLLRYWKQEGDDRARHMADKTLQGICLGGLYDHVGFGFHRYAVDRKWRIPHFEKMLYDQALLVMAYADASLALNNRGYGEIARKSIDYVLRDMTAPEGGFYSSEDADSEGEEGRFYLWTEKELRSVLGRSDAELAVRTFDVSREGNFREHAPGAPAGRNVLYLAGDFARIPEESGISWEEFDRSIERIQEKLFRVREERIHPNKDDKILTDWNGLMVAALGRAAHIFGRGEYALAAEKAASFILSGAQDGLRHSYRSGGWNVGGFLDDYAFLVWGLLELYEATFRTEHLEKAVSLADEMLDRFWDEARGGLFFTANDAENVLVRRKDAYEGAYPSGNSVALYTLFALARLTGDTRYEERAAGLLSSFSGPVTEDPASFTHLLGGVYFDEGRSHEIVICGRAGAGDTRALIDAVRTRYIPNRVVAFKPADELHPVIERLAPFSGDMHMVDGKATAYLCRKGSCLQPVTDPAELSSALEEARTVGTGKAG